MTDCITGVVVGTVLGVLFLFTCIISAVKAVRDRKRIKRKTAQRKHEAEDEYRLSNFNNGASSKFSNGHASEKMQNRQSSVQNSEKYDNANHSTFRLEEKQGIENKIFTDLNDEILSKTCKSSNCLHAESPEAYLNNASEKRHPFSQLSTECTAVQNVTRRNSYKKAVKHNSLIPGDPLPCASSRAILYTCDYDNTSTGAFENKAFNSVDP